MAILVFKTNIRFKKDLRKIERILNNIPGIHRWNVDQQDIDRVLRIEAVYADSTDLINKIKEEGFHCEELPD